MSKLKQIKKDLEEDDIDEMKEVFDFICKNYFLKSYKTKEGYNSRYFTPEEKANYIYRQLPVIYYEKSMIYLLMEQIYYQHRRIDRLNNKDKKYLNKIEELENDNRYKDQQIEELKEYITELRREKDIKEIDDMRLKIIKQQKKIERLETRIAYKMYEKKEI